MVDVRQRPNRGQERSHRILPLINSTDQIDCDNVAVAGTPLVRLPLEGRRGFCGACRRPVQKLLGKRKKALCRVPLPPERRGEVPPFTVPQAPQRPLRQLPQKDAALPAGLL